MNHEPSSCTDENDEIFMRRNFGASITVHHKQQQHTNNNNNNNNNGLNK